jgi:hypothetical protein
MWTKEAFDTLRSQHRQQTAALVGNQRGWLSYAVVRLQGLSV